MFQHLIIELVVLTFLIVALVLSLVLLTRKGSVLPNWQPELSLV